MKHSKNNWLGSLHSYIGRKLFRISGNQRLLETIDRNDNAGRVGDDKRGDCNSGCHSKCGEISGHANQVVNHLQDPGEQKREHDANLGS